MKLRLIAAGTRMPQWVSAGWQQYAQRMPQACPLQLLEIPLTHRGGGVSPEKAKKAEGERMLAAIPRGHRVIALEVTGKSRSTAQLATDLADWMQDGRNVDFLVGGPDGLAPAVIEQAGQQWSLSPLTLPHGLTRIVLAEQLYRAWTILQGHPYHRA
ncbi:MAG: 23S rRNA (pseudouridine(1915)-N(3))-methyltransferase RlmH [Gammaproteobacteria bacterium]|nr:23S rRNA (pseudouridine(1915)-N(3))-methyltransferase RlmH [Gammaproteobacteria bacterium]NNM19898.1 23S rRNA (pseudouridine(1915)-N(3))-methyltransferase RlmH [Gammaproteobacteria bacterium]